MSRDPRDLASEFNEGETIGALPKDGRGDGAGRKALVGRDRHEENLASLGEELDAATAEVRERIRVAGKGPREVNQDDRM